MPTWKETLQSLGDVLSDGFEGLSQTLKQRMHHDEPIQIVPYSGFGNQQLVKVSGRALEYKGEQQADEETLWSNLAHTYQRFESDEIAGLRVQVTFQGQTLEVVTDKEGYFEADLPVNETKANDLWYDYQVDVPTQVLSPQLFKTVAGRVQIPSPQCDFGIISDIDDTIVVTNATSTLSMMRLTFLRSPASRLPFAGVSTFYQALTQGGSVPRPIFYVSSSPWNLYDFLEEFMELNKIPRGTLFLRDFGIHTLKASHHDHKTQYINQLMDAYPNLAFILIGDSGQHDPEVYSQIVSVRPHQVKAIYIRDVSSEESRDSEVLKLAEQTREQHIDLCLVSSTLEAATHAVSKGFIKPEILEQLKAELAQSKSAASKVEAAVGL
jgi:phosphatidate phosphatase APP1